MDWATPASSRCFWALASRLSQLACQSCLLLLKVMAPPLVFLQGYTPSQVRFGQAFQLVFQAHPRFTQVFSSGLQFLG